MKKLYYFLIPSLLLGSCQSDPTLETESSPLVRTKVTELQYAQTDKINLEALNIISPYKFVKKGNFIVKAVVYEMTAFTCYTILFSINISAIHLPNLPQIL